jgi:hypothetical protein
LANGHWHFAKGSHSETEEMISLFCGGYVDTIRKSDGDADSTIYGRGEINFGKTVLFSLFIGDMR